MGDDVVTADGYLPVRREHDSLSGDPPAQIDPFAFRSRAVALRHVIGEQRFDLVAPPGIAGHALIERISTLNRTRLLSAIERVFDEFDIAGEVTRIDRLTIDLGAMAPDALDDIEPRLVAALRAALRQSLAGGVGKGTGPATIATPAASIPTGVALVAAFEHYLLHGVWPYEMGLDLATTPADCLAQLLHDAPLALVAMLRGHGPRNPLLRRLVEQMPEEQLAALLHQLEPEHAAYVLDYLGEVRASHREAPVVPATPAELDEMLWTIVLRDALHQAGLRANRKAFLGRLLLQLSQASGVSVAALVAQLRRGLQRIAPYHNRPSALVGVLADVIADDPGLYAGPAMLAELADTLTGKRRLLARDAAILIATVRQGHRRELRWLLFRLVREDAATLARHGTAAIPLAEMIGLLLDRDSEEVATVATLAETPAEQAMLLRLAVDPAWQKTGADIADFAVAAIAALKHDSGGDPAAVRRVRLSRQSKILPRSGDAAHPNDLSLRGDRMAGAPVDGLARFLDETTWDEDPDALRRAIDAARQADPIGARRLLRDLAAAQPGRLRRALTAAGIDDLPITQLLPDHRTAPIAALARFLDDWTGEEDPGALRRAIDAATDADLIGTRRLLRDLAIADPGRLRRALAATSGEDMPIAWLLPNHLAVPIAALAGLASCDAAESDLVFGVAGRLDEAWLPGAAVREALVAIARARGLSIGELRRRLRSALSHRTVPHVLAAMLRAHRGPAMTASRPYVVLDQAMVLAVDDAPFSPGIRAAAFELLLPALRHLSPDMLRSRFDGIIGRPLLAAMLPAGLRQLAFLLAPPALRRDALAHRLRTADHVTLTDLVRDLLAGSPPHQIALASPPTMDAMTRRMLERASPAWLDAMIAAIWGKAGRLMLAGGTARVRPEALSSLAGYLGIAAGRGTGADGESLRRGARTRGSVSSSDGKRIDHLVQQLPAGDRLRWLVLLAPAASRQGEAVRRLMRAASDRPAAVSAILAALFRGVDIARWRDLPGGAAAMPPAGERPAGIAFAAELRVRPLEAVRRIAISDATAIGAALPALLDTPQSAALAFAALTSRERDEAIALGRLLTSRAGRAAIDPVKVARALAAAAGAREWRSGAAGFTGQWLAALLVLASVAERHALQRLLTAHGDVASATPRAAAKQKHSAGAATTATLPDPSDLAGRVRVLLGAPGRDAAAQLRSILRNPRHRAELARTLREGELATLLARLVPAAAAALMHAAERIAAARRTLGATIPRHLLWLTIFEVAERDPRRLSLLVARLLDGGGDVPPTSLAARTAIEQKLRTTLSGARDAPLRAILDVRERNPRVRQADATRSAGPSPTPHAIHLTNAGLVLASAYLPRLFGVLDFVAPDAAGRYAWRDPGLRNRAIHLLQWLVDERCNAPEPQLALNKLLCGVDPSEPVVASITPQAAELDAVRTLLRTIQAAWPPLAASSPAALRETFLQRDGVLTHGDAGWRLEVEHKVVDILLDRLPWGFSMIRHPWMPEELVVDWR